MVHSGDACGLDHISMHPFHKRRDDGYNRWGLDRRANDDPFHFYLRALTHIHNTSERHVSRVETEFSG
jgi:hypothetical protein